VAPSEPETAPEDETTDLTPPDLIEFFMTEEGPYEAEEIRALVDRTPFLRDVTRCCAACLRRSRSSAARRAEGQAEQPEPAFARARHALPDLDSGVVD
jgi:hypothetical protein